MKQTEIERRLHSTSEWKKTVDPWVADHFEFLGFQCADDFMNIRLFDFFNLDCVDNNRAEEMILGLDKLLNPSRKNDYDDYIHQLLEKKLIRWWIKDRTGVFEKVTIKDLLDDAGLSVEGLLKLFDRVTRYFYKSDEYDSRRYKYSNIEEIPNRM